MSNFTILLVDDDTNVLKSLQRLFRQEREIDVITAENAREAAGVLKRKPVDLVISDERMPEVEGHKFVQYLKKHYPDTIRIILTGYADTEAMKTAVNKGEVYRYLFKPWDENDLLVTVKNALKYAEAEQERKRYAEKLEQLNADLEKKVQQRTAELEKALEIIKRQRDSAHIQLRGTAHFLDSVRALIDNESRSASISHKISETIKRIGEKMDLSIEEVKTAMLAAYFYKIGTLTDTSTSSAEKAAHLNKQEGLMGDIDKTLFEKSAELMSSVLQYPELGEAILYSSENYNGSGKPEGLSSESIPLAARLFRVAFDYEQIKVRRKLPATEAAGFITQHKDSLYDPQIADSLYDIFLDEGKVTSKRVQIDELEAGMVLAEDMYIDNGVLYLAADTKINHEIKKRLQKVVANKLFPLRKDNSVLVVKRGSDG